MNKKVIIPVSVVSLLLLIYSILVLTGSGAFVTGFIFVASPFLIIWMVYAVIRFGDYEGRELNEEEEWGYADKEIKKG